MLWMFMGGKGICLGPNYYLGRGYQVCQCRLQ